MNELFKLTDPITRSTPSAFVAEHGLQPTPDADLTSFGYAWGQADGPSPEPGEGQVVVQGTPELDGAFVSVPWVVRDKTAQDLLAQLPYSDKETAKASVLAWADKFLEPLRRGYSQSEIESWPVKGPAAINYLAGDAKAAELAILQAEADALQASSPSVTVNDVAGIIAAKAEPYLAALAFTSALRQIVNAQIDATTELAEIPPILDTAIATATAKATELDLPT